MLSPGNQNILTPINQRALSKVKRQIGPAIVGNRPVTSLLYRHTPQRSVAEKLHAIALARTIVSPKRRSLSEAMQSAYARLSTRHNEVKACSKMDERGFVHTHVCMHVNSMIKLLITQCVCVRFLAWTYVPGNGCLHIFLERLFHIRLHMESGELACKPRM